MRRGSGRARPLLVIAAVLALSISSPATASSQVASPEFESGPGDGVLLGANALLGGLTAGLWRRARGGAFREGFVAGVVGGALGFVGKRVGAERWDGAGLLGRQIASVGASVVRNASDGRSPVGRLVFPVGPLRLYWTRGPEGDVHVRVDLPTVAMAVYALATDAGFDAGASLSSGVLVFSRTTDPSDDVAVGRAVGATVLLRDDPHLPPAEREAVFAHERVHVLQYDQAQLSWGEPLDGWLVAVVGGSPERRWLDVGAVGAAGMLLQWLAWSEPPWEGEAHGLDGLDEAGSGGTIAPP